MLELLRCLAFFGAEQLLIPVMDSTDYFGVYRLLVLQALRVTYLMSAIGCSLVSLSRLSTLLTERLARRKSKAQDLKAQ